MGTDLRGSTNRAARRRALDRDVAMTLAATEYERVVTVFEQLTPRQWALPTDCADWNVRAMAGHVLGMAQMVATVPELVRQQVASARAAKKSGAATIDALTALQVVKNADLPTAELVRQMAATGTKAARRRRRIPAFVRDRQMPELQDIDGHQEAWTFDFLFDVILTRDPFLHRIDICRATGAPMEATAAHEGVLVDDVVGEWAERHGRPFSLELSGPAGGTWGMPDGERIAMDAFEFCRAVGGRRPMSGLLAQQVPF